MKTKQAKLALAQEGLEPNLRPMLKDHTIDYETASDKHPNYPGGPNLEILSELLRLGWRKIA